MDKLILRNSQAPGDVVMLTAAVRDLHRTHPGRFITDIRSTCPALWENNPYITPIPLEDPTATIIDCEYPLIHQSNKGCYHFIHGFRHHLEEKLGIRIDPTEFKGDLHISEKEKSWISQIHEITGQDTRFWIIVAGGKMDYTIKWWDQSRWQEVVDHFHGRLTFVQVGETGHNHPALSRVIDLRGKTDLRELVRLVYHSDGIICPVTSLMHLAAAVEYRRRPGSFRPCIVVAGGREPNQWEAYPGHQFLHTVGMLPCCSSGGCWRSRTIPVGDNDKKDLPESLCLDVVGRLPRCMDMIRSDDVIRAIEGYLTNCFWLSTKADDLSDVRECQAKPPKQKSVNRLSVLPHNEVEIRVAGMRRSGLHAVINWLSGLYQGTTCFINDVNHSPPIRTDHPCDPLSNVNSSRQIRLNQDKVLLIHNYEDCTLADMQQTLLEPDLRGKSRKIWDVLILRDPYNTFASRIKLWLKDPENDFSRDLLLLNEVGQSQMVQLWKKIAHEFLTHESTPKDGVLLINFNRWNSDAAYRESLCHTLGVAHVDQMREVVSGYGFGSSFDDRQFDGRASQMKLNDRWRGLRADPMFQQLTFSDVELKDLSRRIFGEALSEMDDLNVPETNLHQ